MTFTITRAHVRRGTPRNNRTCATALAMIDAGYVEPSVNSTRITWRENGETRGREITPELASFNWLADSMLRPVLLLRRERRFTLD